MEAAKGERGGHEGAAGGETAQGLTSPIPGAQHLLPHSSVWHGSSLSVFGEKRMVLQRPGCTNHWEDSLWAL